METKVGAEKKTESWWAEGLLFENCNCTAVCPGHIHFKQKCTHEVCHGFWAIRFQAGWVEGVDLSGVDAVVVYETPQVMIEGGWKQVIIISDQATPGQRRAIEAILMGVKGGPWKILAGFVSESLPSRTAPVRIEEAPGKKSVTVEGILRGAVKAIRGRDRNHPVTFRNIYNQIHDTRQTIALGSTHYDDGGLVIETRGTHGLWSRFRWAGG